MSTGPEEQEEVWLVVEFDAAEGRFGELRALLEDVRLEVGDNPDCLAFSLFAPAATPGVIIAFEGWRNETVRQTHLSDSSVARFSAAAPHVLAGPLRKSEWRPL